MVITNKAESPVLEKAKRLGVPVQVVSKAELNDETVIKRLLQQYAIDFIVLAGFLPLIPDLGSSCARGREGCWRDRDGHDSTLGDSRL